ncbi:MAG: glycosyltransferase family 39 protein [Christensenellales bacterium]
MNTEVQQRRAAAMGFVLMIVIEVMLIVYFWQAISYERLVAPSPYPLLGRVIIVVRVCIIITLALLIHKVLKTTIICDYGKSWVYLAATGLMILLGSALRLAIVVQSGELVDVTKSIEYQVASNSLTLTSVAPRSGTWLENSMLYLAKNRLSSCYPLHILPLFIRLLGSSSQSVHYSNILLDVLNMMLLYFCANKRGGGLAGLIAASVYALWPQKIMLCLEASSATFSLTIILVCCALVLSIIEIVSGKAEKVVRTRQLLLPVSLGVFMGLSFFCTTYSVLLVPLWLLLLMISPKQRVPIRSGALGFFKTRFMLSLFILMITLLSQFVIANHMSTKTRQTFPNPYEAIGYSLMVGSNHAADGRWNAEDGAVLADARDAEDGQRRSWVIAAGRLQGMTLKQRTGLIGEKLSYLWRQSDPYLLLSGVVQKPSDSFLTSLLSRRYPGITLAILCFAMLGVYSQWRKQSSFFSVEGGTSIVLLLCVYWFISDTEMYVAFNGTLLLLSVQCLCSAWKPALEEAKVPEQVRSAPSYTVAQLLDSNLVINATIACRDADILEKGGGSIFLQSKYRTTLIVIGEESANM